MAELTVKAESAGKVVLSLLEVVDSLGLSLPIQLHVQTTLRGLGYKTTGTATNVLADTGVHTFISELEKRPGIGCENCTISLATGNPNQFNHQLCRYQSPDQIVGQLELAAHEARYHLALYDAAHERFAIGLQGSLRMAAASPAQAAALDAQQLAVRELTESNRRLSQFLEQQVASHSAFIESATTRLHDAAQKQAHEFMETIASRESELSERQEEIESEFKARVAKFEAEKAEFDARASTVVRRENLQELRRIISDQTEAKVSKPTMGKRLPVHAVCVGAMAVLGAAVGLLSLKILKTESPDWHLLAPTTGALLGFGATLVFYVRWLDAWFRVHSDHEISAQQAQADIIRANWLAELMFEWDKEKAIEFPADLMRTFSQGLFDSHSGPRAMHPAEDLAELMGRLTRLRVGADGVEFEKRAKG